MAGNIYQNIHVQGCGRVLLGNEYTLEPKDQKILKWLSPLDPWPKHKEARDQYRQGTLDWFFSDRTFLKWLNGDTQVLWCPGPMGTGKTILMATILDRLHEHDFAGQDVAIAFIYCQHQARDVQTLSNILGCLLSQLYMKGTDTVKIPSSISDAYRIRPKAPPTAKSLQQWFVRDVESRQRTILLLDGLDEVDQLLRDELLHGIGFSDIPGLQLLVTSRQLPDIGLSLLHPTVLQIYAPDSSVDALITSRLKSPSSRKIMRLVEAEGTALGNANTLDQAIRHNITAKAKGMLLLPSLQLDLVLRSRSLADIRKTLDSLPPTLNKFYDMTWERICNYEDTRDSTYAKIILTWVVHSAQPLSLRQLQHAIAASLIDDLNIKDALIPQEDILSLCTGILTCSAATLGNVSFGHLSAVEHFNSRCLEYFPDAHDLIARACVRYLEIWLDSPSDSHTDRKTGEVLADTDTLAKRFRVAKRPKVLREWDNDFHRQIEIGELDFLPPNTADANARRLFNIDRSGLGSGKQLILLGYAYGNLWHHARQATLAQYDVLQLIERWPVLYIIAESDGWNGRMRCPCPFWMDTKSAFWLMTRAIHSGLLNHARFVELSRGISIPNQCCTAVDSPEVDSMESSVVRICEGLLTSPSLREMALKQRVYLLFAPQIAAKGHSKQRLLELVRMTLLQWDRREDHEVGSSFPWHGIKQIDDFSTQALLIDSILSDDYVQLERLLQEGSDTELMTGSGARALWYAYTSRSLGCLKCLVEHGADISALRDDPVLSFPDASIELMGIAQRNECILKFLAYGPDKSWFAGLDYVVGDPACVKGVWQARIEMKIETPEPVRISSLHKLLNSFPFENMFGDPDRLGKVIEYLRKLLGLWKPEVDVDEPGLSRKVFQSVERLLDLWRQCSDVTCLTESHLIHSMALQTLIRDMTLRVWCSKLTMSESDAMVERLESWGRDVELYSA